jgi:2,4-dienoyl-CoA reductase-like NADH-dependent reductase (Old Yellow Enzyme family)
MSKLFTPFTLKDITLHNRIVVSPMCQYSCVDGFATDWHLVHLGCRAVGGAALIIQEATAVSPEGRISADDLGIWKDEHLEKLTAINAFIRQQGAVPGIQLAHAGRKASTLSAWKGGKHISQANGGWQTVAPSAIPFRDTDEAPLALDKTEIEKVIHDFTAAAYRALQAGYQVLELHSAHGYLLHQFLSPLSNHRTDEYGGRFENRTRLLLQVLEGVQSVWPSNLPIFVRISATDWAEGGWNEDDSVKLATILKSKGVDLIDCSTGGLVMGVRIPVGPGYQVYFAEKIRKEAGIPTSAVGLITTARQAEDIIAQGQADLILIARQSLRDPYFPIHAAQELGAEIHWPDQYLRAKE